MGLATVQAAEARLWAVAAFRRETVSLGIPISTLNLQQRDERRMLSSGAFREPGEVPLSFTLPEVEGHTHPPPPPQGTP